MLFEGSETSNPTLNEDLREDDPDVRVTEAEDDMRVEAENEFYDGDRDQVYFTT